MISVGKSNRGRAAFARAAIVLVGGLTVLPEMSKSQVSSFSPEEHLTAQVQKQDAQQLLAELSTSRHNLDAHPSAEANLSLGRALNALGESDAAGTFFDRAVELNPKLVEALFEKGLIVCDSGDWSKAASLFREAVTLSPRYAPAHLALGEMLLRVGDFDAALTEFTTSLRLDSNSAGAHQGMGLVHLQEGSLDLAVADFHSALAIRPRYIDAEKGLARALASQHKWNEAAALLKKVVTEKPNSSEEASALGTALANMGDKKGAAEQFVRARELSGHEFNLLRAKGDSNFGISLRNESKISEAAAAFRRAIEDDPTFCDAHDDLGEVLWLQRDQANALIEFQTAVRCDGSSAMAHNNLGSALLYSSHDVEGAIDQFQTAITLRPGFALAHLNLGKALAAREDFASAETELRNAVALNPASAAAHLNLGLVLAAKTASLSAEAQSELQTAVHFDPHLRDLIPQQYLVGTH